MATTYKQRIKDCKYYVESALANNGWKVNDELQEKYQEHECAVIYHNMVSEIESNMSYKLISYIKIIFDVERNNEMPYYVAPMLEWMTTTVIQSGCPHASSFAVTDVTPIWSEGRTYRIEITARYYQEIGYLNNQAEF